MVEEHKFNHLTLRITSNNICLYCLLTLLFFTLCAWSSYELLLTTNKYLLPKKIIIILNNIDSNCGIAKNINEYIN